VIFLLASLSPTVNGADGLTTWVVCRHGNCLSPRGNVCLFGMRLLWNCWMDLAEILQGRSSVSHILLAVAAWVLPGEPKMYHLGYIMSVLYWPTCTWIVSSLSDWWSLLWMIYRQSYRADFWIFALIMLIRSIFMSPQNTAELFQPTGCYLITYVVLYWALLTMTSVIALIHHEHSTTHPFWVAGRSAVIFLMLCWYSEMFLVKPCSFEFSHICWLMFLA